MAGKILVLLTLSFGIALADIDCVAFKQKYSDALSIENDRTRLEKNLQSKGFFMTDSDVGFDSTKLLTCSNSSSSFWYDDGKADLFTTTARLVADEDASQLSSFGSNAQCVGRVAVPLQSRLKYRAINGYGNNLNEPFMGSVGAAHGRFAPKNYYDDIHTTRKSVSGDYLPNPRKIIQNVLLKADVSPRSVPLQANSLVNLAFLFIAKDLTLPVPVAAVDKCKEIRCCSKGNKKILSKKLRHSSCLPIAIDENDKFYKDHGVGCLNYVRSDISSLPSSIQFGEIKNTATASLDLSLIYGVEDSETKVIRSFKKGKLNMNAKNLLPTDCKGKYTKTSQQFLSVPTTAIIPSLFARHHNKLADGLAALNPKWNDEKLFQEARRINIAVFQKIVFNGSLLELLSGKNVVEPFDATLDCATNIELNTAYRCSHMSVSGKVETVNDCGVVTTISLSDSFGKTDVAEDKFDDLLRGISSQQLKIGEISEEFLNKFAKNEDGVGIDIFSINVVMGRDQGLPTYLDARRKCGLSDVLTDVFPQSYIDLLRGSYETDEDIDLFVGASLESLNGNDKYIYGETLRCIMDETFKKTVASDAYYYSNPSSPYPFSPAQIQAINNFDFNNLCCVNSRLDKIAPKPFLVDNNTDNKKVSCSLYKPLNLAAWKNV